MFINITKHCEQQILKRNPKKNKYWGIYIFKKMLDCYHKKELIKGNRVNFYTTDTPGVYKIISGKYGFVFNKSGTDYILITFLTKEKILKLNGTKYNLNN